ncbi:MAG: DNA primase [Acidimicrobiales bacterium]
MGIVADDIARVRAASDLVSVAGEHLALRRVGQRWVGLCPFHAEKTPSFSVNGAEGLYYCFGCGAKGDAITFVREVEHLEFAEAVERLAARAGISISYDDAAVGRDRQRRAALVEVMARAVDWYHQRLLTGRDGAAARAYLRGERGYDGDVVRSYRIGWAPDEWDALCRALRVPVDVLRDTGLGLLNRIDRQQDTFRARIMFPIFDAAGDPVAFGGRALPGADGPKYKNSAEGPLYSKSRVLYGLNWAKAAVVARAEVVVCEGYTDVIGLHRAGVAQAVATCGTALAEQHFHTLKNFARRVVLAFDADPAGQAAAERLYQWEQRYELDLAVASLPGGLDPGELARRDPDALRAAVAGARPFLAFRLDRALDGADLRSPEGRARAAAAAVAVVAEHPSDLVRDQYLMQVADRTRIDADRLRRLLADGPRGGRPAGEQRPAPAPAGLRRPARGGPEVEAMRVAVHSRAALAGRLHEALFTDPVVRAAYRAWSSTPTLHDAIAAADPSAAALLQRLAVEDADADPDDVLGRLVDEAGQRALGDLEAAARQADDPTAYGPLIAWLKPAIEEVREPTTRAEATDRLLRWLAGLQA